MEDYRMLVYKYHRDGLDQMADDAEKGRAAITEALNLLESSKDARTMSQLPVLFTEYKRDEMVNIYSGKGTSEERDPYTYKTMPLSTNWTSVSRRVFPSLRVKQVPESPSCWGLSDCCWVNVPT